MAPPNAGADGDDLTRALSLDFDRMENAQDVASWAYFLRDQFCKLQQQHQSLVREHEQFLDHVNRTNTRILFDKIQTSTLHDKSAPLKYFFQQHPFASIYNAEDIPTVNSQFATAFFDMVLDQVVVGGNGIENEWFHMVDHGQQDIQEIARNIWQTQDLGSIIHHQLAVWRAKYSSRIQLVIDQYLPDCNHVRQVMTDILDCTDLGSPVRQASYMTLHPIFGAFPSCPARVQMWPEKNHREHGNGMILIQGRRVRDFFTRAEEAFVLTAIRKHMLHLLGLDGNSNAAEEVSPSLHQGFLPQDVRYFRRMKALLEMHDMVTEASILGHCFDTFSPEHHGRY